jgi:hypothetical protein
MARKAGAAPSSDAAAAASQHPEPGQACRLRLIGFGARLSMARSLPLVRVAIALEWGREHAPSVAMGHIARLLIRKYCNSAAPI